MRCSVCLGFEARYGAKARLRRHQYLPACGRQTRHGRPRPRLRRLARRLWMQHPLPKPIIKIVPAAFARFRRRLRSRTAGCRADNTCGCGSDNRVPTTAAPWTASCDPTGVPAQCFLDRGIDEDALHGRILGGGADELGVRGRPDFGIDVEPIVAHHHGGGHQLTLFARQGCAQASVSARHPHRARSDGWCDL